MSSDDVVSFQRLGKRREVKSRPLKITLKSTEDKYHFLNLRRAISKNETTNKKFHTRVFVNCDSSFLVQKEENRLRQRCKQLNLDNPGSCYIRSGALYQGDSIVDRIDVKNQLF